MALKLEVVPLQISFIRLFLLMYFSFIHIVLPPMNKVYSSSKAFSFHLHCTKVYC